MSFLWPECWLLGLYSRREKAGGKRSKTSVLPALLADAQYAGKTGATAIGHSMSPAVAT